MRGSGESSEGEEGVGESVSTGHRPSFSSCVAFLESDARAKEGGGRVVERPGWTRTRGARTRRWRSTTRRTWVETGMGSTGGTERERTRGRKVSLKGGAGEVVLAVVMVLVTVCEV